MDPSTPLNTDQEDLAEAPGPCPSEHPVSALPALAAPALQACFCPNPSLGTLLSQLRDPTSPLDETKPRSAAVAMEEMSHTGNKEVPWDPPATAARRLTDGARHVHPSHSAHAHSPARGVRVSQGPTGN